jgi:hypothetical protein
MAMSDGYVANWDSKYVYKFWRPGTAVRLADIDGNPDTTAIAKAVVGVERCNPEYDSGHSIRCGRRRGHEAVLGTDNMTFETCSYSMPVGTNCGEAAPTMRIFTSFSGGRRERAVAHSGGLAFP